MSPDAAPPDDVEELKRRLAASEARCDRLEEFLRMVRRMADGLGEGRAGGSLA